MLGNQSTKTKHSLNSTPPKLQRIPKSESAESQTRNNSKISRSITNKKSQVIENNEGNWYTHSRNELLHSCDGSLPKPAQNIALLAGKKYIVVPKNNSMAVQPAVTNKQEKIGDKPPILKESSLIDVSNSTEVSLSSSEILGKGSSMKLGKTDQDKSTGSSSLLGRNFSDLRNNIITDDEQYTEVNSSMERNDLEIKQTNINPDDAFNKSEENIESSERNSSYLNDCANRDLTVVDLTNRRNLKITSSLKILRENSAELSDSGDKESLDFTSNHFGSKDSEILRMRSK